jgi:NitT/TauT family transport system permease protein
MSALRPSWQGVLAAVLTLLSLLFLPLVRAEIGFAAPGMTAIITAMIIGFLALAIFADAAGTKGRLSLTLLALAPHLAVVLLLGELSAGNGIATTSFFLLLAASWLMGWRLVTVLAGDGRNRGWFINLVIPSLFGIWLLILWEAIVRGAGIPFVLLPPPSAIGARFAASIPILAADLYQTVFKAVLFGFFVGSFAGFLVAVLADRYKFLANGLLPIGNMVSALPIIGIAPIMVIWFGFDWHSKAAVVIVMTFFPMLVNTLAGLSASGNMERDLMRTYASNHWQTLFKLRLPAAMPFVFNALKINSTLAMIGAIVSEFFGTPVVGMGFRISTEVGRMNLDMVWAEIALAAIVGSLFYGALALLERTITFWHPSYRR